MVKRLLLGLLLLLALATSASYWHYRQFRADTYAKWIQASQLAQTAKGQVEYISKGQGQALLQFHGTPSSYRGNLNVPSYDALFGRYRLISASRPGYLRTPLGTGRSPAQQADAFAALTDSLGLEQVVVVGISGGGPGAIHFASRHPQKCAALVLIEALAEKPDQPMAGTGTGFYVTLLEQILENNFLMWLLSDTILGHLFPQLSAREQQAMAPDFEEYLSQFGQFKDGLVNDAQQFANLGPLPLADIRCPTLVLHGTLDHIVPFAHGKQVASTVPGAQLVAFEGRGHDMLYTDAPRIMTEIQAFLETLAP